MPIADCRFENIIGATLPIDQQAQSDFKTRIGLAANRQLAIGNWQYPLLVLVYIHIFGVDDVVITGRTRG